MAERKRNKEIHFYVTEEERKLIRRKMIESKTKNMGAYLRKMAIDGYIVNTDTTPLKKQYEEMHKIGININQIAKTHRLLCYGASLCGAEYGICTDV